MTEITAISIPCQSNLCNITNMIFLQECTGYQPTGGLKICIREILIKASFESTETCLFEFVKVLREPQTTNQELLFKADI